jgi:putative addiction module component (TIGR02574 family)
VVRDGGIIPRMSAAELQKLLHLSVAERMQLAQDIWDSIASDPDAIEVTPAQRAELDRRLAADDEIGGDTWEAVRDRVSRKK